VLVALAVNLVAGLLLIPSLAADGAALATLLTELVSLAILASAESGHEVELHHQI